MTSAFEPEPTDVTVPIVSPLGYTPPMPEVMRVSPGTTLTEFSVYSRERLPSSPEFSALTTQTSRVR